MERKITKESKKYLTVIAKELCQFCLEEAVKEMEIAEFLQTTEQKNMKNYIGMKVKKKLQEYEQIMRERQQILKDILELENAQYDEEIVQLMTEKVNEQFRKRLEWINTKCMERVKAEEELLKLKNQQRELENCEKWRHLQSKQILLDSKKGQLYQIENTKLQNQKEKETDKLWHQVMERLNSEKKYQEIYETELRKAIAKANQLKNQETSYNNKNQRELEDQEAKRNLKNENQKALLMEEESRRKERHWEALNKIHLNQMLKSQIASNFEKKALQAQLYLKEDRLQNVIDDRKFLSQLEKIERQKIRNNEWHKYCLRNSREENQQKLQKQNEFDRMYLNTGCVLQQGAKNPYGRKTR